MKETKKHSLIRYILLFFFVITYFIYTIYKFGFSNGLLVSSLTWSFFIFCTPIADAGFILAFPVRVLIGVRMIYTQIASFVLAAIITLIAITVRPIAFHKTLILELYHQILFHPIPYWIIIILSLIGTFFSIYFGDELMDVDHYQERKLYHRHINKYKILISFFIFVSVILFYKFLIDKIGLAIPLF
ncbi:MAG TPA: hypothetical protein ENL06_00325 [Candidatus Portnoybacteria bacterium]|nr:hypothetical protein [Candidatus Portnoybacteria bacterium]